MPSELERKTGFEPATLTLARSGHMALTRDFVSAVPSPCQIQFSSSRTVRNGTSAFAVTCWYRSTAT